MNSKKTSYLGIREIAQIANVSTATVSRVINHPEKCSAATREKVEQIIKDYKYVPNEAIKTVFSKSSKTIAIFVFDISNPFFYQLITELNNLCFENQYTLLICDTENNSEKEKAYLEFCIAKRCTGIILTEGLNTSIFKSISIPLVYLDREDSSTSSSVTSENYFSICKLVDYLYNLGHRRIAFVGTNHNYMSVVSRYQGYKDSLEKKGIPFHSDYVFKQGISLNPKLGKHALQHFLSLPQIPTAVICANDMIAMGLINEARALNISVPETLSVCGFDHVLSDLFYPPLTTIKQNIPQMAQSIFNAITQENYSPSHIILDTTFIPGRTCAKAIDSEPVNLPL